MYKRCYIMYNSILWVIALMILFVALFAFAKDAQYYKIIINNIYCHTTDNDVIDDLNSRILPKEIYDCTRNKL